MTDDRGSAVLLVPAAVLIVLGLAMLTVDGSRALLAQRRAAAAATAVANDLAALGVDRAGFQLDGELRLLPEPELRGLATALVADGVVTVRRVDDRSVEVRVEITVTPWWGRGALPGLGELRVGAPARGDLEGDV
ncbi:MAG: hypothetical protein AAGA99_01830 [Actinomycetota bacterium]